MPSRISPFERLSATIAAAIAGKYLHVEGSVLKRGLATRQPREIEVLVTRGNGENLLLIECRAYKRAQDALWIEQLDDKRRSLGFDSVLAISRSGFTRAAQAEAKACGIEVARLTEAEAADWSTWKFGIPSILLGRVDALPEEAPFTPIGAAAMDMLPASGS